MTRITGWSFPPARFKAIEINKAAETSQLTQLLIGEIPCLHFKNALSSQSCSDLLSAFLNSPGRRPRADGVPGDVIGFYHYGKTFSEYINEAGIHNRFVEEFLEQGGDPVERVLTLMRASLRRINSDAILRPALWASQESPKARALSWTSKGRFLLEPHEDVGQLDNPLQKGFEAQSARYGVVVAVNMYPSIPPGGGRLKIWNVIPDDTSRIRVGAQNTGYPYPLEELANLTAIEITPEPGSIVIMNGGLVHAVTGYEDLINLNTDIRLLINFFAGWINPTTMVHWV